MKTFGDKPTAFQLEEDGEFYYIGSEVRACSCPMKPFSAATNFYRLFL